MSRRAGIVGAVFATAAATLLAWSVREMQWRHLAALLSRLGPGQIALLLLLDGAALAAQALRWSAVVSALGARVPLLSLAALRLAGFAINYVTPGIQVGGEVMRAVVLARHHALRRSAAAASVAVDKVVEIVFALLVVAVAFVAVPDDGPTGLVLVVLRVPALAGLVLGTGIVAALTLGWRPLASALRRPTGRPRRPGRRRGRNLALAALRAEARASRAFTGRPWMLGVALVASVLYWLALVAGFGVLMGALGICIPFHALLAVLAFTHLASHFLPVPAGIGSNEASHVGAFAAVAVGPVPALAVALMVRGRDFFWATAGLLLAAGLSRTDRSQARHTAAPVNPLL